MKKGITLSLFSNKRTLTKLLMIMKLTLFLMIFGVFQLQATLYSQDGLFTLNMENTSMRSIFKEIERQSELRFFYNDLLTNVDKNVTVVAENLKIDQLLNRLLEGSDLTYKIMENNLVLISPKALLQQKKVTGKVLSGLTGEALPGVNVMIKGTNIGTVTDIEGKFSIIITSDDAVLVFSFVGYNTEEVVVGTQTDIAINLIESIEALDEIVVIGYGTQRKGDVTAAVVSVKSDEFIEGAVKDAGQLIQGKVAGLSITNPSGNPLDGVQIMLRGNSTLNASTEPLVIVDGVPGNLDLVAPQDIESIDVLKDGSAAAIYGTRGTNGVIFLTTKKGRKNQALTAEYNAYGSIQSIYRKADFYDAGDYRRLIAAGDTSLEDLGYSTDWLGEITRIPISHMHNLSVSGGTENTNYIGTVNYTNTQGIFLHSEIEKITARLDVTHSMFKNKLSVNVGLLTRISGYNDIDANGAYRQALIHNPTEPVKNPDGTWFERPGKFQYENPVALLEEAEGDTKARENRIYGNITLAPITGLKLKALGSYNHWNSTSGYFQSLNHISNVRDMQSGYVSRDASLTEDKLLELTAEYTRSFGQHRVSALVGYSYQDYSYEYFGMNNKFFPTDAFGYNRIVLGSGLEEGVANMWSGKNMSKLIGFFGRINYNYGEKYLFQASIRQEGSSKFGENYQWGSFPAVQAGWRISKESFMQGVDVINDLKIRIGYGVTGIEPTEPYQSLTLLNYSDRILINGEWQRTIEPYSNPNPDLRWEKKKETNIGIDFALLNERISGTIDLYKRKTEDLLWDYTVPKPPYIYGSIFANVGVMENKGIEVLVNFVPVKKTNFIWNTSVNFSANDNKLVTLSNDLFKMESGYIDAGYTGDPIQQSTHRIFIGESIGDFWGYKEVGVDNNGEWLIETPPDSLGNVDTIPYLSATDADKQVLGNGLPKFYLGWNHTFRYKGFDLGIVMRGAFGFQILNFQRMFYENPTITYNMLEGAHDPIYGGDTLLASTQAYVSYYIEDGDYWKIDNVTLGYTFNFKRNKIIKSLRIYASGLNLYTFTKYKGIDPEISRTAETSDPATGWDPGNDNRDKYPTTRTFSLGLSAKF
ncbi:MAG: SusC/RagA family TonB-linked outer membrane protein [Bacteroidales bacterium]|nr:SusC/RagA family TonB-linked outer membrane protein [Bacteroidales bacterium]